VSVILVVHPDSLQAKVLHDIARRIGVELVIVDSTKRAIEAIGKTVPDLILLSALLSPREEGKLMARLRALEGASHLQTLTLPQFQRSEETTFRKSGFGFRKKQKAPAAVGCDPAAFGEEIVAQLARAKEIRSQPPRPAKMAMAPEPLVELEQFVATPSMPDPAVQVPDVEVSTVFESVFDRPAADSVPSVPHQAYDSIFVEPTNYEATIDEPTNYEPANHEPATHERGTFEATNVDTTTFDFSSFESTTVEPTNLEFANPEPPAVSFVFEPPAASVIAEDEIDKLVRQLGLDVRLIEIDEVGAAAKPSVAAPEESFDFNAALDRARLDAEERRAADIAEAEAIREAAIAEAHAAAEARAAAEREAREALAADLARVQAEAEAMREAAITEARAAAEREARETLNAELARVRSETEVTVADALNRVKVEAEEAERVRLEAERMRAEAQEAFAAELARVRAEVEQKLTAQLEAARTEAERMRSAEAAAVRERAAAEAQLKSELERLRFVSAQARKADESVSKKATEQIKRLEGELATVRAKAEERRLAELDEIKAQMAELREAAAQHVRDAAAEAVAAEVARASKQAAAVMSFIAEPVIPPKPSESVPKRNESGSKQRAGGFVSLNLREETFVPQPERESPPRAVIAPFPTRDVTPAEESQEEGVERLSRDYLSLWQPVPEPVAVEESVEIEAEEEEPLDEPSLGPELRRHAKWALPVAACLLLVVTGTGTAINTVARFVGPEEKPPALTVEPVNTEPFIEVVDKRLGRLRVESTPAGAEAIVNGRSYGKTPVTIPDLEIGTHNLVLKSRTGTIRRKVTVKANETTVLSEAIFSGWLAIFSPIPVNVVIDGKPVSLTDNGRVMTTPGKHTVELINDRFNYRATETLEVRPGETTAYTASVPTGTVRVTAPPGAEVRIDGQPVNGAAGAGVALAIGSHEVSATLPERGERRVAVDVRHGALTEVTLRFDQ
jgi:CheY-like chemotaxis protein